MKQQQQEKSSLYLEVVSQTEELCLPLHSSIVLFLLSYCECDSFTVFLVCNQSDSCQAARSLVPESFDLSVIEVDGLPQLVRGCRMPAVLDRTRTLCRAGLAVVLRHIINQTLQAEPNKNYVLSLLGFKKTCLKACAEVSKWTRLCEIDIPSAVEEHLKNPSNEHLQVPLSILQLEQRLREPVKVHNDDKIRRQKLRQQRLNEKTESPTGQGNKESESQSAHSSEDGEGLELRTALAKLDSVLILTTRENPEIRKVKTTDLPQLEHVFAEGLYFTLTDVVLLPCIYHYLNSIQSHAVSTLNQIPHLLRWYNHVQEVPGVCRAAEACGMTLSRPQTPLSIPPGLSAKADLGEQVEQEQLEMTTQLPFVGGPRPTMTKLKGNGIEALFAPHPRPAWTLPWDSLPAAINPTEGKMSDIRTVRKKQQLNNLVALVMELARPGDTIVDFCSGTGHVGIVLAHTLPNCQVILIENKEESLIRAQARSAELGLTNIGFIQANLDYFTGPFQIGVALHACGVATDMVMEHCLQAGAAFTISPCCYGFIPNAIKFTFPRSKRFQETLTYKEHMILCRFADQTAVQLPPERRHIGKQCMGLVDLDRSWAVEAHGYSVRVMTMEPESCSPKNNMLVGHPLQKSALADGVNKGETPEHIQDGEEPTTVQQDQLVKL